MGVDWLVVATAAGPVLGVVIGVALTRALERKPRLVTYYGHVSAFTANTPNGRMEIYTHNLVVRNNGAKTARNVRLGHNQLPDFNVSPHVEYQVRELVDGAKEIVFPTMVPGEQVTISYLYFPPMTYGQVNTYVKSDEGMAKVLTVLLQRQYPTWFNVTAVILFFVGVIAVLYLIVQVMIMWISGSGGA